MAVIHLKRPQNLNHKERSKLKLYGHKRTVQNLNSYFPHSQKLETSKCPSTGELICTAAHYHSAAPLSSRKSWRWCRQRHGQASPHSIRWVKEADEKEHMADVIRSLLRKANLGQWWREWGQVAEWGGKQKAGSALIVRKGLRHFWVIQTQFLGCVCM